MFILSSNCICKSIWVISFQLIVVICNSRRRSVDSLIDFHVNSFQPMAFRPRPVRAVFRGSSCPTQWKLLMASTWTWTSSSMLMILKKAIPSKGSTFSEGSRAHPNSALCPEISVFLGMGLGLPPRKARGLGRPPWGPNLNHGWQRSNRSLTSGQAKVELRAWAAGGQPVRELATFQLSPKRK